MRDNIAERRREIDATRQALKNVKGLIPRSELVDRFCAHVDARAALIARVPPSGQKWTSIAVMLRGFGDWQEPTPIDIQQMAEVLDFLYFFAGDALKAGAPRLLNIEGWKEGLPTSKRPELIARLEREQAEQEADEEHNCDAANAEGVSIEARKEVRERRDREAREREEQEKRQASARKEQTVIDQRAAPRAIKESEYVTAIKNRHRSL